MICTHDKWNGIGGALFQAVAQRLVIVLVLLFFATVTPGAFAQQVPAAKPLAPPDRSSPRATLQSFLDNASLSWRLTLAGDGAAEIPRNAAERCIDFNNVPVASRSDVALETSIKLFDVFNRIPLPPPEAIPDAGEVAASGITFWRIPDTGIFIKRVAEGPRAGEWLFSAEIITQVDEAYALTRSLPVKPNAVIDDGYWYYTTKGGSLLDDDWILALPNWLLQVYFDQALWQ